MTCRSISEKSTLHFHVDIIAQWLMAHASFLGGDSISVNAVIGAFEKGHQWQQAMCATGLGQPDIFRCCALITACRRGTLAAFVGYPRWWTGNSPGNSCCFASKLWNELRLSHLKQLILSQGNWISNHSKVYFKDSCTLATTWHWVRHAVGGRSSWVLSLLNPFAAACTQHSGIQRCHQRMWDLRPVVAGHKLVWGRAMNRRKAVVKMWYTHGIPGRIPPQFMEFVLREIMINHHKPPKLQWSYFQTPSCLTKSLKTMKMFCLDTKSPRIPAVQQVPSTLIKSFHDGLLWHILGKPGGSGRSSSNKVAMKLSNKLSNPAISCNILQSKESIEDVKVNQRSLTVDDRFGCSTRSHLLQCHDQRLWKGSSLAFGIAPLWINGAGEGMITAVNDPMVISGHQWSGCRLELEVSIGWRWTECSRLSTRSWIVFVPWFLYGCRDGMDSIPHAEGHLFWVKLYIYTDRYNIV